MSLKTSTDEGDCAQRRARGEPCASDGTLGGLVLFLGLVSNDTSPDKLKAKVERAPAAVKKDVIRQAEKKMKCEGEACVIEKAADKLPGEAAAAAQNDLLTAIKPRGPRDTTELTDNFQLDGVLFRWASDAKLAGFCPYPFAMMDQVGSRDHALSHTPVSQVLTGGRQPPLLYGPHAAAAPRPNPCSTMGHRAMYCAAILNTDVSTGRGKHWVCIFADARTEPATIEYFDSAGNPPPPEVTGWLTATRDGLAAAGVTAHIVIPGRIRHQRSRTECGLYALYYIRRRCEGAPPGEFAKTRVTDEAMTKFRKHVFR